LIAAADNIFFIIAYYVSLDMCFWSNSSCQTSCVWVKTESVLYSDTDQVEKW